MTEIIVFRFETCPNCDRLEELVRLLRENGIVEDTRHPDMIRMRFGEENHERECGKE